MVFSTILFLFRFLPITLALYYLAPAKLKNTVLFVCSLVFYCWGEVRFFPIMLALIALNYLCGLGLERFDQSEPARKAFLLAGLVGSLGMLFYFKYANFVLTSANALLGTSFAPIQGISTLPLGISFYTFQTLSYTIDVYRREVKTEHNVIDFGAYVVMFPQLIAGPIVKYRDVAAQLHVYKNRYRLPATTLTNCLQEYVTSAPVRRCSIARYWRFQRESRPRIRQIQGAYQERPLACRDSLLGEL